MSSLVRTYVDTLGALQREEPVRVRLPTPGGGEAIVTAIPERIQHPQTGEELMQLHFQVDSPVGPMEAQVRMSPETYHKSLVGAGNMVPRLKTIENRRLLRSGK